MILKKIDFGLGLQLGMELLRMFERMEMETVALSLVSFLMIPFVLGSLFSLGLAAIWQLVCLGLKAGFVLFGVCSVIMAVFRFKYGFKWKDFMKGRRSRMTRFGAVDMEGGEAGSKLKCCMLDVVLSVFFQTGLSVPTAVWETGIEFLLRNKEKKIKLEKKKLKEIELASFGPQSVRVRAGDREFISSAYDQYQYGNTYLNKNLDLPFPSPCFTENEPSEMEECEDLTDEIEPNRAEFAEYMTQLILPADTDPRKRTRRRSQTPPATVTSPKVKVRTVKPGKLTRARKNKNKV